MDRGEGERRLVLVMMGLGAMYVTILYVFLFVSLWHYKELVGLSLLVVLILVVVVYLRGRLNEQHLRQVRYHHQVEIPLDMQGEPYYWPQDVQENPHHVMHPVAQPHVPSSYEGGYERGW